MVYHAVARGFEVAGVIVEDPVPRSTLARRRLKTLGAATVAGQVLFTAAVLPVLRFRARARVAAIRGEFGLNDGPFGGNVVRVASVNTPEARSALRAMRPDVVVVNGTRIIDAETLGAGSCPYLNMHAGITPLYRGVHGGYWALAEARPDLLGTTVHLVSTGIDTGRVVTQVTFPVALDDSFATYPLLHTAHGLPALIEAVGRSLRGELRTWKNPRKLASRLRSHPTAWGYLGRRLRAGVR